MKATFAEGLPRHLGLVEWFRPGEQERVEQVLADLKSIGAGRLRTGISWADWYTPEGIPWYDWLIPRLAGEVELLPCVLYPPPSIGLEQKTSSPPARTLDYADFIDLFIDRFGEHFEYLELWNEPNNLSEWDWTLDPHWTKFGEMIGAAAYWARQRGKKTVLGGMSPIDGHWLCRMFELGVMERVLHGGLPPIESGDWRTGDQRYYVSDTRKFYRAAGWTPRYSVQDGVKRLYGWLRDSVQRSARPAPGYADIYPASGVEAI